MDISIIVATARNNAIGKDNDLLWHLPADMKFFRETTSGHCILTGRKNYISIPPKFRPLKNRTNIVLTRDTSFQEEGIEVFHDLAEAIAFAKAQQESELFIIGGGEVYRQALPFCTKLYITEVDHEPQEADTFFPSIDEKEWNLENERSYTADEKNPYDMVFKTYSKKIN